MRLRMSIPQLSKYKFVLVCGKKFPMTEPRAGFCVNIGIPCISSRKILFVMLVSEEMLQSRFPVLSVDVGFKAIL